MPIKKDYAAISAGIEDGLKVILNQLIDGTVSDLDGPVREIANNLTIAVKRKRQDLVDESADQLALILMEKEIVVKSGVSNMLPQLLNFGMNALVNGAIAGLAGLKAV